MAITELHIKENVLMPFTYSTPKLFYWTITDYWLSDYKLS